jgi:hypothetical protein
MHVILIVAVLLVAVVLVLAATKPSTFRVERSTVVDAAPDLLFPLIDDFHRWPEWSPYEKLDPTMKRTLSGAASGQGAVYEWSGNNKAGAGRMEIIESSPPAKVAIKLDFIKPFEAHNAAEFTMRPQGGATLLTWQMHGPASFKSKLMQVFVNLDKLIGKDFETGLANLKARVEGKHA